LKQTIIILILAIIIIFISIFLYRNNIEKNSLMTCIRDNNDKVVIKFNVDGIEKIDINDKEMTDIELLIYTADLTSDFVWNNIAYDEYSELELIREHMKDVKKYEEEHLEYKSKCDY